MGLHQPTPQFPAGDRLGISVFSITGSVTARSRNTKQFSFKKTDHSHLAQTNLLAITPQQLFFWWWIWSHGSWQKDPGGEDRIRKNVDGDVLSNGLEVSGVRPTLRIARRYSSKVVDGNAYLRSKDTNLK